MRSRGVGKVLAPVHFRSLNPGTGTRHFRNLNCSKGRSLPQVRHTFRSFSIGNPKIFARAPVARESQIATFWALLGM